MIARIWRGTVREADAHDYIDYMNRTGIKEYEETPGNRGVLMLSRKVGETREFLLLSVWDSVQSIKAFAGDDITQARFYPEDDRYLVNRDTTVNHYDVVSSSLDKTLTASSPLS